MSLTEETSAGKSGRRAPGRQTQPEADGAAEGDARVIVIRLCVCVYVCVCVRCETLGLISCKPVTGYSE